MNKAVLWQHLIPQHICSNLVGSLTRCRVNWLKNHLIDLFIKQYGITLEDALNPDPYAYKDLESFFIREVDAKKRPFTLEPKNIASPVDGTISQFGKIAGDELIQAKGFSFDLTNLLGKSEEDAASFLDGDFITIYLSPKNYHRVFMPIDGSLQKTIYIPGRLFAVNQKTAEAIPNLYGKNERLVLFFETKFGPLAIILVGALIVSGIHTSWAGKIQCKGFNRKICVASYSANKLILNRAQEMGYFTFGSTVILLFPKNKISWNSSLIKNNQAIQIGQLLGSLN
jgi:phosphatidylserine decarboxylase